MNKLSAKKKLIGMILLPAFFSGAVAVQAVNAASDHNSNIQQPVGYGSEGNTGKTWRSTYDLGNHCWRTGYWDETMTTEECDGIKEEKVAEVAPAPAPVPAPIAPPQKLTFSADALFDFDKDILKPNGKIALDEFVRGLEGVSYDVIVTEGHADRIGSAEYNQRLSLRRAESVKAYLVSRGIPGNRIFTEGKGKTQPVTGSMCDGKSGQALRACLEPDRRVEVEVSGIR